MASIRSQMKAIVAAAALAAAQGGGGDLNAKPLAAPVIAGNSGKAADAASKNLGPNQGKVKFVENTNNPHNNPLLVDGIKRRSDPSGRMASNIESYKSDAGLDLPTQQVILDAAAATRRFAMENNLGAYLNVSPGMTNQRLAPEPLQ